MSEPYPVEAELGRFIQERICEGCGEFWLGALTSQWACRVEKKAGYTLRRWRNWKLCLGCSLNFTEFERIVLPVLDEMCCKMRVEIREAQREMFDYRSGTEARVLSEDRVGHGWTRQAMTVKL